MLEIQQKKSPARPRPPQLPCALSVAGSDSGGGAGIQADLKTFAAMGVHGTTAITAITAQNPKGVRSIQPTRPAIVIDQIEMICAELPPRAVKTGMLFSEAIVEAVAVALAPVKAPLVLDPVMVATSGALLLRKPAIQQILNKLFPRASLVTPNLNETEYLLNRKLLEPEHLRSAAREIHERWGCAALVKGGHLTRLTRAIDFYFDGKDEFLLESDFVRGVSTHGTGCTYSAAITAYLARGENLVTAVSKAKEFITNAIANAHRCCHHDVLNSFWA